MLDDFVALHANARELMQTGAVQQAFKGAPLRVSLRGTRWSAPACWSQVKPPAALTTSPVKALAKPWKPGCWRPRR
jgi:hypothetical protein